MSPSDGHLAYRVLTVAVLLMVTLATPVGAVGWSTAASGPAQGSIGDGDPQPAVAPTDVCIEIEGDGITQCAGATNVVSAKYTKLDTDAPEVLKFRVNATIESGVTSGEYDVEAHIDQGGWAAGSLTDDPTLLSIEKQYRGGSIQYPTLRVRVVDPSTGAVVGINSAVLDNGYRVPSADEDPFETFQYDEDGDLTQTKTDSPEKGATVSNQDSRYVRQPTYSFPSRFNDGDERHEPFEDVSLPPVEYNDAGAKVGGPKGDIKFFENLREAGNLPAILSHDENEMRLGTMLYGVPSADFAKMRIDYALQSEARNQHVQVNLVDRYGNVIDPSVANSEARRLYHTVSVDDDSYFQDRKQYENAISKDNLNTATIEFKLTDEEREYIQNNNEVYVTYRTDNRAHLLLYRTPIISQSVEDQTNDDFVPETKWFEEEFNELGGEEDPATFDAQYKVYGAINDKYNSIDRRPNEPLKLQVTVTNNGDERVERRIGVYSMSENNESLYDNPQPDVIDRRTVAVEPHSKKTILINKTWDDYEFGYHNVSVVDTTDPDNPQRIARERDGENVTQVYVLQPATFEVRNVIAPNSWLIHDNFNVTVVVQNVGDLDGTGTIHGEFQDWSGTMTIPETEGGIVREGQAGEFANVTFSREGYNYSPSYPERPTNGNDALRPNSPYGSNLTYGDAGHNESKFTATTLPEYTKPNPRLYDSLLHNKTADETRIYKLQIITMFVEGERTNEDTWYASGYGYANNTSSPYWDAGTYVNNGAYDILERPIGAMPVYGYQYVYPPVKTGDQNDEMNVTVRIFNNGTADTGTARVKVMTDKIGLDSSGVAGTAGATNIGPWESQNISVPITIRNDPGNDGEHRLEAKVRTKPDYIKQYEEGGDEAHDTLDNQEAFVNVEVWEDFLFQHTGGTNVLNERCTGYNPSDTESESVDCEDAAQEYYDLTQWHKNVGGTNGSLTVNAYIHAYSDPSGQSQYSDFRWVAGSNEYSTNYYDNQTQDILANENKSFTAQDLPFKEPGVYATAAYPHRANNEDGSLSTYEQYEQVPEEDWHVFKVLDITDPESYGDIRDTTYPCKSGTCDGSDGTWTVWEGATVQFDNDSVDNVVINRLLWGGVSYDGGDKNCPGTYCYSGAGYNADETTDKPVHRFDSPGTYNITLQVWDHPAYGEGATVGTTGTPNSDKDGWDITVKDDTYPPSVSVYVSDKNNPDGSPDSTTVWKSDGDYDGIEVCYTATQSDDEIGIESDWWSGVSGSKNQDTRCRTYSSTGEKTVEYEAWDFAGLSDYDSTKVTVKEDTSDPSVTLTGTRSSEWVDKAYWSSSVTWDADASDGETGLVNCDDGGAYTWWGDTNGDASSCSDSFTTSYHSASESGTTFRVDVKVEDYHGNTDSDYDTVVQYEDKTDPYVDGEYEECSAGYDTDGCSVTAYLSYYDKGPNYGIGVYKTDGPTSVTASADANADASDADCGTWVYDYDDDYVSETTYVYDYHGNYDYDTITAYAEDYDKEYAGDC